MTRIEPKVPIAIGRLDDQIAHPGPLEHVQRHFDTRIAQRPDLTVEISKPVHRPPSHPYDHVVGPDTCLIRRATGGNSMNQYSPCYRLTEYSEPGTRRLGRTTPDQEIGEDWLELIDGNKHVSRDLVVAGHCVLN